MELQVLEEHDVCADLIEESSARIMTLVKTRQLDTKTPSPVVGHQQDCLLILGQIIL